MDPVLVSAVSFTCACRRCVLTDDKGGLGPDHISDNSHGQPFLWSPIRRSDLTWNFEKFLINQNGVPVKRYSPKFPTEDCAADIKALIENGPNALF